MPSPAIGGKPPPHDSPPNELTLHPIEECPLFRGLPERARREVAAGARTREARKGETLFRQGDPARELAVLTRGRLKLTHVAPGGATTFIQLIGPTEVCDWPGTLTDELHWSSAVAVEPGAVLVWEKPPLTRLFDRHPVLYRNALRMLAQREQEIAQRCHELSTLHVPQRLARALLRLSSPSGPWPEDGGLREIPLSGKELAQLSGTTLFTVSRLLSQWEAEGLIETRRKCVRVEKPAALAAIGKHSTR